MIKVNVYQYKNKKNHGDETTFRLQRYSVEKSQDKVN